MKKHIIFSLIYVLTVFLFVGAGCTKKNVNINITNQPLLGGDRDAHGCIGSAGYNWCEAKQKCLRSWEEKCEAEPIAINLQEITFERECPKLSEQIKSLIEQTNYCTKDSDCIYESFGCPFGCYTVLSNKTIGAVQKIKEGVNIYDEKCMLCLYDCGGPPKSLSCEKNKCIENTDETKSNIIDKCDIGRDYVRESELNNFPCTKKPGCEWSHRGGMQEPMYACCPIDIDITKDLGIYSRCGADVD